jgi:hypothetical protein
MDTRGTAPAVATQEGGSPLTPGLANKRGRQTGVPLSITLKIHKNEFLEPAGDE